jgi:sugar-specific transcriptional regulator TrmB/DNA-binding CsgD family transcriptional regulator
MVLGPLGLSPIEERIYDTLVTGPAMTVSELTQQLGVSRARVARTVPALTAKGLVTRLPGRAARFSAVDPAVAVGALAQHQEQALARVRDRMRELAGLFGSRHNGTHPAEQVEIIDGADNVWNTSVRLQHAATEQLRVFDTPPYLERHPDRENADERAVLSKGLTGRCVYARSAVLLPGRYTHIRAAIRSGEQARVTASLPMKMLVCDSQLALIPVTPVAAAGPSAAYLIYPSSLLDALAALFEAYWDRAVPLNLATAREPETAEPPSGLTTADHRILALLAGGATDDVIGRATGCSMRTVQRRIRELMRLAGAQTRFQLGMAATHRRWV